MAHTPVVDPASFSGIFVKHKGQRRQKDGTPPPIGERLRLCIMDDAESPTTASEFGSETFTTSACSTQRESRPPSEDGHASSPDFAVCPVGQSQTDDLDDQSDFSRRNKRKKVKPVEENTAVDAIRYKTKMCKSWQLTEKCPYGPRCLFAHGVKDLRSHSLNHAAISTASCTRSPERNFYSLGNFPPFMPVPYDEESEAVSEPRTHSPYSATPSPPPDASAMLCEIPHQPSMLMQYPMPNMLVPVCSPYAFYQPMFQPQYMLPNQFSCFPMYPSEGSTDFSSAVDSF